MTFFQRGDRSPEKAPQKVPEKVPQKAPEKMSEKIPEKFPEKMQDRPAEKPNLLAASSTPVSRDVSHDKASTVEWDARRIQPTAQPLSSSAPKPQTTQGSPMSNQASVHAPSVSVISKALKITGQLESSEDIQIDGQIEGDVRGVHVKVGQNAKVKGTVYGEEVEVAGTVEGRIEAKKVVLASTAHMSGDVMHQDLRIDSGAFIDGNCKPEFGKTAAKASVSPVAASPSIAAARTAAE